MTTEQAEQVIQLLKYIIYFLGVITGVNLITIFAKAWIRNG